MERTEQPEQPDSPHATREDTTATALDIIERLASQPYQWTAITALAWGMAPKQDGHTSAVAAAEAAGLVRTASIRGQQMVQLAVDVVSVTRIDTAAIVVANQPDSLTCRYAVDTWALPTAAETDPELADWARRPAGQPYLIDQGGDDDTDGVARMVADAEAYLASIGIHAEAGRVAR